MGGSNSKSRRHNISAGTDDTDSNLSGRSSGQKEKKKNGRMSKQVSQTSAGSQGSMPNSPSSSSPPPADQHNPHANHLKYRRSKSMDNVLEGTPFDVSTDCNGASDIRKVPVDRRASMDELNKSRIFKPLVAGDTILDSSPSLPPKRYSPRSSPKITRSSTPGQKVVDKLPRSSSPGGNHRMGRQFTKSRLAKSFDDLKLIGADVDQSLPNDTKPVIFLSMYDFEAINDDDLAFKKGDRLKKVVAGDTADWVVCINLTNGNKGYIPVNYVMVDDDSPQAQDWWFECSRTDAETWLMRLGLATGSFLVRHSTDKKTYVLSVRSSDGPGKTPVVRHYKIHNSDKQVYIGDRKKFSDIKLLVKHYKETDDGLVCRLTEPCPRTAPVPHMRNIEIHPDMIRRTERLGAGFFGEVWRGRFRGKMDIAIKMLKPGRMTPREFLREAKTMNQLRHVRLVQLLGVCTTCEPMLLITEFMPNGALLDYLRRDRRPRLEFQQMINMTRQVAEGMAYLESQSYIHRDLRAGNILVGEHLDVKVADFGLARVCDDGSTYIAGGSKFPVKWTAPEAVLYSKFSIKSDVWSFGVLMYEIATFGREPYAGMSPSEAVQEVSRGFRLPKPHHGWLPGKIDPYYLVMQLCWKKEPKERPSFFHLYNVFEDFQSHMEQAYREML